MDTEGSCVGVDRARRVPRSLLPNPYSLIPDTAVEFPNMRHPSAVWEGVTGEAVAVSIPADPPTTPAERLALLFDTHHGRLYQLARRLTNSREDARDLVQETYM